MNRIKPFPYNVGPYRVIYMIIQFHNVLTNTIYKLYANYGRQVYYVKIGEKILVCMRPTGRYGYKNLPFG